MKKILPVLTITALVAISANGQSGRRNTNPPPPVERTTEEPIVTRPDYIPVAPAELSAIPESLMDREIKGVEPGSLRLADFNGKVIVVNLWASWCGPCRIEVPDYEKVRKQYAERDVEFIGLTTEDPRTASERVQKFARDFNFHFRLGWADPLMARTLMNGRSAIPQTLVIGRDGRVISHWRGYSRSQSGERLRDIIENALKEPAAQR
jgi:thiol-disulfide isomerase/thioredoxin